MNDKASQIAVGHTPGPWELTISGPNADTAYVRVLGWGTVAIIGLNQRLPHWDEPQRANARLIAAAPDLLVALQDVIGWIPGATAWHTDEPMKAVERARAAITLATGSEK